MNAPRLRVACVLPDLKPQGGWRTHAAGLIRALRERVDLTLYAGAADAGLARQLFPGLPLYLLPATQHASLGSWRGRRALAATGWAVRRGQFPPADLVHSLEAYPAGLVGSWLAARLKVPHVLTVHGTYGVIWAGQPWDRPAYEQVLRGARLICPVSDGTRQRLDKHFGSAFQGIPVRTILNGNDFTRSVPAEEALAHVFPPEPVLLTVGDVKPRKGQAASLAAFARVRARLPDARYHIVGAFRPDQPYYQELQAYIAGHGLEGVSFLGRVSAEDLRREYREASLFVLAPQAEGYHFEGFGLVYLEAGAYGLPVIGTRTGGVPDAVRDGETGLLVEPGDVEGLAAAILRLLSDSDLARRLGQANRRWAESLTWERTAAEQVEAYREVCPA